jgi:hypothetical protein
MVWRTPTGAHHVSAGNPSADQPIAFDLDSTAFAPRWNTSWNGSPRNFTSDFYMADLFLHGGFNGTVIGLPN